MPKIIGMSQEWMAECLGVNRELIGRWETGQYPSAKNLFAICMVLDVSADELLGITKQDRVAE